MAVKEILFYILFFLSGLFFGSFLNLLIYKIPRKLPIIKPISKCPNCGRNISFYRVLPIISFVIGKGKCRNCGKKINFLTFINPIVEILTALLFLGCYAFFGFRLHGLLIINGLILSALLILISFIDLRFKIISNAIVLPFTIVGIIINVLIYVFTFPSKWWMPLAFSAGAFAFMLIIHFIYPQGMGMGDVKFSLMLGAFLVKSVIPGLFLGFLIGAIIGLILIITKKKGLKQSIPFGPFISIGSAIVLFWGTDILRWYLHFF